LADHHQRPALTRPDSIDQPVQHIAFAAPARQLRHASVDGRVCRHLHPIDATRPPAGRDD
ncbi:MAG TPA: hypothetical protein VN961_07760, partial [Streptosporangiaceae bacterium]|nr:hypothetical protein [Streptosporangiaceae bacterium]